LPGITFKPRQGKGALDTDRLFLGSVYLSSNGRAYLDNMRVSRARHGDTPRTLSRKEIEERLEQVLRHSGEAGLNSIRDEARGLKDALDANKEFKALDTLIGSLLRTRDTDMVSEVGKARKKGVPFDPERIDKFIKLFDALNALAPVHRHSLQNKQQSKANLSFFEAYFSNFIEGTEFELDEAIDIVFNGHIPNDRPEDAHDVLGTFKVVSNYPEMACVPNSSEELSEFLRQRHAVFMEQRPEKSPGAFKVKNNQAGSSLFVAPELVEGTLEKGFEIYQSIRVPFHRAVFLMFMISEIHPFLDGNGRAARIMMNAELVAADEEKIIIPTIYRTNYLSALKALTHNNLTDPLIRTLDFAQKYTQSIDWSDFEIARKQLSITNAFMDPISADETGVRLVLYQDNMGIEP
jgi:Fic family protein